MTAQSARDQTAAAGNAAASRPARKRKAKPAERVRRLLREHIAAAVATIDDLPASPRASVHSVRKQLKRVRAAIRLLAEADGLDLRPVEIACRDVARRLSPLRDLDVMISLLGAQEGKIEGWPTDLREGLVQRREAAIASGVIGDDARALMAAELERADEVIAALPLEDIDGKDLKRALRRSHRKAGRATRRCRKKGTAERFHELRKRAKREHFQRELLEATMILPHPDRTAQLAKLCTSLGDLQDVAVMRKTVEEGDRLSPVIDDWLRKGRTRLRRRVVKQASQLYYS